MRIAYLVTRSDTIGGSHIHVRDMARAMTEGGHQASVLIGGNGPVVEYFKDYGIEPLAIPSLQRDISPVEDFKAYFAIKRELVKFNPDIVSTHSSKAGYLGRIVAKRLGIPVLFTAHGWSFTDGKGGFKTSLYKSLERWIEPVTDRIITVSEYDRQLALEVFEMDENKIITIHNGMFDVRDSLRADPGSGSVVNIVKIARLDTQKNHSDLLEAVCEIKNIHLHFVGDGPLTDQIKKKAEELGIVENITFWGRLNSVDEVLSRGHIFVLISNWEGFPRSTLEAMRAGLPTVVSNAGGASEAVDHGETGYVVEKGDVKSLSEYLKVLVSDPELRHKMGIQARMKYENHFLFRIMFNKTVQVYHEMIGTPESEKKMFKND